MKKQRLDKIIFDRGLCQSKERAKTTVMSGVVFVDGKPLDKPGAQISPDSKIEIKGQANPYVSRGGLKLERALEEFNINPQGLVCIDCGASTGGFTDCLLRRGASKVYAVDVGYGQLAWNLRNDERVIVMERTNIRYLTEKDIPEKIDLAVIDLSFISLKLALPPVECLLSGEGRAVCLIKPQFEAGREKVGKKGVVRDPAIHREVLSAFISYAGEAGFMTIGLTFSPIKGPEGNIEFFGCLTREKAVFQPPGAAEAVEAAYSYFAENNGCEK